MPQRGGKRDNMKKLPIFKGYTIDCRLKELKNLNYHHSINELKLKN
jgi:hypothetical protein